MLVCSVDIGDVFVCVVVTKSVETDGEEEVDNVVVLGDEDDDNKVDVDSMLVK